MTGIGVAVGREIQPSREPFEDRLGRQQAGARGGELERQRQAIEALAQQSHRGCGLDPCVDAARALREERHRLVEDERGQIESHLGADVERLATRHDEAERRGVLYEGCEVSCDRRKQLLDVVHQDVRSPIADARRDSLQ